jgi:hypothetical protein
MNVAHRGACRLSLNPLRGHGAKRTLNYKGIFGVESKLARSDLREARRRVATGEKKPEHLRLGLNPPKEEVEETRYICRTATTNELSIGSRLLQSKKICMVEITTIM